ncbi:MAG: L-2-amino-thiazoline-4-carboxylic acid hydrolase [Candidatus Sabulitectum sp.]|nr:L-2-amino-thiazoline-4-carboxylic acid hydrolase [Candidatus Sabulitectum sp.]
MDNGNMEKHKFLEDSGMTFQEVFDFTFQRFISIMLGLSNELGDDIFLETLKRVSSETASEEVSNNTLKKIADGQPNDFAAFKAWAKDPSRLMRHVLTFDIVEDTGRVFEISVTECLWAKTFRENGASNIGYVTLCHTDYAGCQAFNKKISMTRTKTLMQGNDCCNHRWTWEE